MTTASEKRAEEHLYSADAPISSAREDLLNRAPFARALARAITGWKGDESLVIGLSGKWGSGKSSIKNIVIEAIGPSSEVLQFNPWQWAAQDLLTKAFFEEIAVSLGKADRSSAGRKRSIRFKYYGQLLQTAAHAATGLRNIIPYAIVLAAIVGYSASSLMGGAVPLALRVVVVLGFVVAAMRWGGDFAVKTSEALESHRALHEKTLEEQKIALRDSLAELNKPILIVIDDIDRLTGPEVRHLLQLVKANTNFPRLVFLLLYDRKVIEKFLNDDGFPGSEYLRKIIQVPFDVPAASLSHIQKILFSRLDKILARIKTSQTFDEVRWGNVFFGGLNSYFQDLRSVYRFTATLNFHVSLFEGAVFEVNTLDLIALETLRVFEPDVYSRLQWAKDLVTGVGSGTSSASKKAEVDEILSQAAPSRTEDVKSILKNLFPRLDSIYGNTFYDASTAETWLHDARVCSTEKFDRYFQLSLAEDDLSESELNELLEATADYSAFMQKMESLEHRKLLPITFQRLDSYKQKIPIDNSTPFLTALMDMADDLPDNDSASFIGPSINASRILYWYLMQDTDPVGRGRRLFEAFDASTGLYLVAGQIGNDEARESKGEIDRLLIEKPTREQLKENWLNKVRKVEPAALLAKNTAAYLLFRWIDWGKQNEVQEWATGNLDSPAMSLKLVAALTSRGTSQVFGDKVAKVHWRINLEQLDKIFPTETVRKNLDKISRSALTGKDLVAFDAFKAALKRRAEGKSGDSFFDD